MLCFVHFFFLSSCTYLFNIYNMYKQYIHTLLVHSDKTIQIIILSCQVIDPLWIKYLVINQYIPFQIFFLIFHFYLLYIQKLPRFWWSSQNKKFTGQNAAPLIFRWHKMSRQHMYVTLQNDKRFDKYIREKATCFTNYLRT